MCGLDRCEDRVGLNHSLSPEYFLNDALSVSIYIFLTQFLHVGDSTFVAMIGDLPNIDVGHSNKPVVIRQYESVISGVFVATDDDTLIARDSSNDKVTGRGHLASRKDLDSFIK